MSNVFPDNYASEKRLAMQIEAEWSDFLLSDFLQSEMLAAKRIGWSEYIVGPAYYHAVSDWISSLIGSRGSALRVADVGSGLGRFIYELMGRLPEVESAVYAEPSPALYGLASDILRTELKNLRVPFLKGIGEVGWYDQEVSAPLDVKRLHKIRMVNGSADVLAVEGSSFDLVAALNVLDQCAYPSRLARQIVGLVAPDGHVVLSCAHQFQERFYIDPMAVFGSLHEVFDGGGWRLIAETELSYVFRTGERHWNRFLSHHVMYQRVV